MNTQSNKNFSILLLLAGTLLVGFSTGRWLFPLAAWIGPALIMRYARDDNGSDAVTGRVGEPHLSWVAFDD